MTAPVDLSPDISLPPDVEIWRGGLDLADRRLEALERTLSVDERIRADRFRFDLDRRRFVARRGLLREILGSYFAAEPSSVELRAGQHGRLELAARRGEDPLHLSCSHSRGLALFAVARRRRIGIDVERLRPIAEASEVTRACFSPRERAALEALHEREWPAAFFAGWTRKEAYLKAIGVGLGVAPDGIEVTLAPGEAPALLTVRGDAREAARWALHALSPGPGYAAAIAVESV